MDAATNIAIWIAIIVSMLLRIGAVETGITAYSQSEVPGGKRFVLQGPDPRLPGGDPSWPGYSRILARALEGKGFVADAASPDLVIRVSYRVGDTQTWTTTSRPESPSVSSSNLRTIQVEALDAASVAAGKPTVVWRTHAKSRGNGDDLAKVFPVMVAAMQDYFGANVAEQIDVTKRIDDADVARLRGKAEASEGAFRPPGQW